ncbi:MAG: DNA phosphorothioation-associated protein 4 [Microcoleus sp. SU_5_3]|nr:DNA phosphorothioation-associated protein 4 [Microcoleus sp. SU_5_3]
MAEKFITRPAKFEKLIDRLTEQGPFETKQAAMTFAAAVGWYFVRKRDPRGKGSQEIRWNVVESSNDDAFIHALALAESDSIEILGRDRQKDEDDPIKVFEEYATAGFQYIQDKCVDVPGDLLDNLLDLIAEVNTSPSDPPPGLEGYRLKLSTSS